MRTASGTGQESLLSMEILESLEVRDRREMRMPTYLTGSIKIKGALAIPKDLNDGDKVLIRIFGPDGEELAQGEAQLVEPPRMIPIKLEGYTIGYDRAHTATI